LSGISALGRRQYVGKIYEHLSGLVSISLEAGNHDVGTTNAEDSRHTTLCAGFYMTTRPQETGFNTIIIIIIITFFYHHHH